MKLARLKELEHKYQLIEYWLALSSAAGFVFHLKCGYLLPDKCPQNGIWGWDAYWMVFYFAVILLMLLKMKEHFTHPH
jgi:hypothetical protein